MALFRNPKTTVWAVIAFLALMLGSWFLPSKCHAADFEFSAGSTYIRGTTPALAADVVFKDVVANRADLYAGVMLIGSSTHKGEEQPNQAIYRFGIRNHVGPLAFGIGGAVLQNDDIYNSGKLNYNLNISYDVFKWDTKELILRVDHISNAGTHKPNLGRDMLMAVLKFK